MVNEINDAMRQYWKASEEITTNKPKNPKAFGVKVPDSTKLIMVITAVLIILVAVGEIM